MKKSNIILIGMPGSGKSTIGVVLAKKTSRDFVDTDVLIQTVEKRSLQTIIDSDGYMELRRIEENTLLKLNCTNHVISTGGSAAYSDAAMNHLKSSGFAVFLHVQLTTLLERVNDFETRGLAKRPEQTFEDLFYERFALYKKYADITIDNSFLTLEEACETIIRCT
jgi:shikimate kinase